MYILLALSDSLKFFIERYLGVFPYLGHSQKQSMGRLHHPRGIRFSLRNWFTIILHGDVSVYIYSK